MRITATFADDIALCMVWHEFLETITSKTSLFTNTMTNFRTGA